MLSLLSSTFFFFNDTATTEIYTLSLHDALPICLLQGRCHISLQGPPYNRAYRSPAGGGRNRLAWGRRRGQSRRPDKRGDRKSTRLNSSHLVISYAVFCLKKKKKTDTKLNIADQR